MVLLVEALDGAHCELAHLDEMGTMLPDAVVKALEQRDALAETLKSLPDEERERLKPTYLAALEKAWVEEAVAVPVREEVMRDLAGLSEVVRRRALVNRQLYGVLRGVPLRSDFGGC